MNGAFAAKSNQVTTYTKTKVNSALSSKTNQSTTYTKTEVNGALAKTKQLTTYTKTKVENALAMKLSQLTAGDPAYSTRCSDSHGLSNLDELPYVLGLVRQSLELQLGSEGDA